MIPSSSLPAINDLPRDESALSDRDFQDGNNPDVAGIVPSAALQQGVKEDYARYKTTLQNYLQLEALHPATVSPHKTVDSIQSFPDTGQPMVAFIQGHYAFLPLFCLGLVRTETILGDNTLTVRVYLRGVRASLIEMHAPQLSDDFIRLHIVKGLLCRTTSEEMQPGYFDFIRSIPAGFIMTALIGFKPSLPWWLYRATQAWVHAFAMWVYRQKLTLAPPKVNKQINIPDSHERNDL